MAPKTPRKGYNLFFRFNRIVFANPSILEFECTKENRQLYKSFVQTVLNDNRDASLQGEDESAEKYMGNEDFTGMSRKVGDEWQKIDALKRSVFDELAKDESNNYKQGVYETYRSYARKQWESNLVPTQEAMAALGRQHLATLRKDVEIEVSATGSERMESQPRLDEVMASNSSWHAPETNQVQFNSPDAKLKTSTPPLTTMLHAASMPETNLNRAHDFSQEETYSYQVHYFQNEAYVQPHSVNPIHNSAEHATQAQADPFIRKSYSLNDVPEVDMSNETIFEMVVSTWGLNPSLNQLPLVQDNEHISAEDLSQLLSAIAHEQIFS